MALLEETEPLLDAESIEFYWDHPVDFVHDNIIIPAREKMPGIEITWQQKDLLNAISEYSNVSVESGHGCHAKGTMIRMFDGTTKAVQDIELGDQIMGDDSTPRNIRALYRGCEQMYRIQYKSGGHYDVNKSHVLCLVASQSHGKQSFGDITEISIKDYFAKSTRWQRTNIGYKVPVEYSEKHLEIDPYVFGCWLGDGTSDCAEICNPDPEIIEAWTKEAAKFETTIKMYREIHYSTHSNGKRNKFRLALKNLGVIKNKHIPSHYMTASHSQRLELLAGILDSDGYLECNKRTFEIVQKREILANQIVELARSIGCHATVRKVRKECCNNGVWGTYHRMFIGRNTEQIPTRVARKIPGSKKQRGLSFGFDISQLGVGSYYGFEVDGNQRYLLEDFTVTHNSGKSAALSWAAIWFTATRYNNSGNLVKVPIIAPTFHQLYDIIWPEFKRWLPLSRLYSMFETRTDEIFVKKAKDSCFIRARSPKTSDHIQGFHSAHLLWLCDEAFGITAKDVWTTVDGSLTDDLHLKENKIVMCGQHTCITGYVHDTFHRDKDLWKNLRFNSEESPIADEAFSQRMARKYGKNSDTYRVRVLGTEPKGNPEALIQLMEVEEAKKREVEEKGKLKMGVDPARFGDDLFVVTIARGKKVFPQQNLSTSDTDDMERLVLKMLRDYREESGCTQWCYIKIDNGGGYGGGLIDKLKKNKTDRIVVIPINNETDNNHPRYANNASVMWGELAEMINEIQLPNDEDADFLADEIAGRTYGHDGQDRIKISPKKQYKKDHDDDSPDRADSLVLCLTEGAVPQKIFPAYIPTNADYNRNYPIQWNQVDPKNAQVAVILVGEKDFGLSGTMFFWGRKSRKLYVYAEFFKLTPVATVIAATIKEKLQIPLRTNNPSEIGCSQIFCNRELFKGGKDTIAQLRKYGIRLKRPNAYDQAGSIMLVNQMWEEQQIVVHSSCKETSRQYETWALKKGLPAKGFPQCEALCMMASILKEDGELAKEALLPKYSQRRKKFHDKLYKSHAEGTKIATTKKGQSREYDYLL